MNKIKDKIAYTLTIFTSILAFVFYFASKKLYIYVDDIIIMQNILSLITILICIFLIYKYYDDEYKKYIIIGICIYLITSFIRIAFMIYNDPSVVHDAYDPSPDSSGHLGYILHIYEYAKVPISTHGVLYHPPLYYILCALFINIAKVFNYVDYQDIVYTAKIFSFIIVNFSVLVIYKIISFINISEKIKLLIFGMVTAHPILIRFSGIINNDVLATLFYLLAIYCLILLYKNTNIINTIILGIVIALGILTKENLLTFVPFMMLILIIKMIKEKNIKPIFNIIIITIIAITPFIIYKIVTMSEGKSFSVYNLMGFLDIKKIITYLIGIDKTVYESIYYGDLTTVEGSMIPYLFKTEIFMEYTIYNMFFIPHILFFANIIITAYSVFNAIRVMIRYIINKERKLQDLLLFMLYAVQFGSIFYYSLLDSRTCTPAFRFIVPIIIPKFYFALRDTDNNKISSKVINAISILYIFSSLIIFMKLGIIQDVALYRTVS